MPPSKKIFKKNLDFCQNVAIAVLAVLAVFLFSRTEIFQLGRQATEMRAITETRNLSGTAADSALRAPVRVCVTGQDGCRYAALAMTAADEAFPADIFSQAFRDGGKWTESGAAEFQDAIRGKNYIYLDFLYPLPLDLLAGLTEASARRESGDADFKSGSPARNGAGASDLTARYAVLYAQENNKNNNSENIIFLIWDGGENYYKRDTTAEVPELQAAIRICEASFRREDNINNNLNNNINMTGRAFFAMDLMDLNNGNNFNNNYYNNPDGIDDGDQDKNYDLNNNINLRKDLNLNESGESWPRADEMSLLLYPEDQPIAPVLSMRMGLADAEQLLTALRFNPRTNFRYIESNGTEVVVDGSRSVRIRANGSVYYQSGGRPEISVECAGESPDYWEAAAGCAALLDNILTTWDGAAPVYVTEAARDGERMILRFGYQINGTPIRFPDGGSAAVATLDGRVISSLELRPRRYAARDEISLLLPLRQALGIAGGQAEISLGYLDTGSSRLNIQWLAGK